jgi:ABC-2 type transport system ATP-binding protein
MTVTKPTTRTTARSTPASTTPTSTTPIIRVDRLSKTYPGGVEAVRGISFSVAPGEVFGLLGPNGAGKSTTIGMLTTTIQPTGGSARLAGYDVVRQPLLARRASSVVFQEAVVDRALTGRRHLELHARLWGVDAQTAREQADELVVGFGLTEVIDRPVGDYSGGQRRRLEIARALVSMPRVLFLDEPTVGLDTRIRYELLDLIATLRNRNGMTTVLTTHYLDEAQRLCDRIAIVRAGEIAALDTPQGLLETLGTEIVEVRVDGRPDAALGVLRDRGLAGADAFVAGSTLHVPVAPNTAPQRQRALIDQLLPTSTVTVRPPTLDDVYLQLTGADEAA